MSDLAKFGLLWALGTWLNSFGLVESRLDAAFRCWLGGNKTGRYAWEYQTPYEETA